MGFWAIVGHFGPFGAILGHIWAILGHLRTTLGHFYAKLREVQFFLRDRWGRNTFF